jgi:hypothetical protein
MPGTQATTKKLTGWMGTSRASTRGVRGTHPTRQFFSGGLGSGHPFCTALLRLRNSLLLALFPLNSKLLFRSRQINASTTSELIDFPEELSRVSTRPQWFSIAGGNEHRWSPKKKHNGAGEGSIQNHWLELIRQLVQKELVTLPNLSLRSKRGAKRHVRIREVKEESYGLACDVLGGFDVSTTRGMPALCYCSLNLTVTKTCGTEKREKYLHCTNAKLGSLNCRRSTS